MNVFMFRDWKITTKIIAIAACTILAALLGMLLFSLPFVDKKLMDEKRAATKNLAEAAYTFIADYDARAQKGEFSLQEAQKRASLAVKSMRYKENEYFFVTDLMRFSPNYQIFASLFIIL